MRKSKIIQMRIEPELKSQIQAAAKEKNMSMSMFISETLKERIGNRRGRK